MWQRNPEDEALPRSETLTGWVLAPMHMSFRIPSDCTFTKESRSAYNTYTCEVLTAYYLWNYLEVSSDSRTPLPHPVITILGLKRSPSG